MSNAQVRDLNKTCGMSDPGVSPKTVAQLLWMSQTPEGTQPRGSGQIHPLETPSSSVGSSGVMSLCLLGQGIYEQHARSVSVNQSVGPSRPPSCL
jgi:hypothetical protein